MKELKVIFSPFYSEDEFVEEVSGIVFRKGRNTEVHTISLEEGKVSGIQSALRKNILIPYDKATLDFIKGNGLVEIVEKEIASKAEEVAEESKEEKKIEKKVEKKTRGSRKTQKESE